MRHSPFLKFNLIVCFLAGLLTAVHPTALAETPQTTTRTAQSQEALFDFALDCLSHGDTACVDLQLNKLPTQSPLTKVLKGLLAKSQGNIDDTLRWLLPLQADAQLPPAASTALHQALAEAYQQLGDPIRAITQFTLAERTLSDDKAILQNQETLWKLMANADRDTLVALRGESEETVVQGWIDLAITMQDQRSVQDWRVLYPDHPASEAFLRSLLEQRPASSAQASGLNGKIALLLPFNVANFYPISDAIERGFSTAKQLNQDQNPVQIYATDGNKQTIVALYQQAIKEGAQFVVGPLTRDEVTALSSLGDTLPVITLALNQPEEPLRSPHLHTFGLSAENEAEQLAKLGRDGGYQSALIVSTDNTIAMRLSKVFHEAWIAEGGHVLAKVNVKKTDSLEELRAAFANQPLADMIVLACDYELARRIKPALNTATPTFGFSHIFAGVSDDPEDASLNSVHFIDMPWVLNPQQERFKLLREASNDLPQGPMQRWFALGVDAYQLLNTLARGAETTETLFGLTGKLTIPPQGPIQRDLSVGQFTTNGLRIEKTP